MQLLFDEAEERANDALDIALANEGTESLDAASCYHALAGVERGVPILLHDVVGSDHSCS